MSDSLFMYDRVLEPMMLRYREAGDGIRYIFTIPVCLVLVPLLVLVFLEHMLRAAFWAP